MADPKAKVRIVGQNELGLAFRSALKDVDGFGTRIRNVLGAAGGFLGFGVAIGAVVRNTVEAQNAFAQLEAAVKSTGGAAGFSAKELAEMAGGLQNTTTYADDAIQAMQGVLLTFTRVRGPEFQSAQKAILDVATRMGTDLKSAALQVGKALNDPIAGLGSLSRAGIQFTDQQKDTIKSLVETGRVGEAQRVVLKELEVQFGGSAEAARNTLGGALAGLKNAFGDLLEVAPETTGQVGGVTTAINDLAALLARPEIRDGIQSLASGILGVASAAFEAAAAVGNFWTVLRGNEVERLTRQIVELQTRLKGLAPGSFDYKKWSAELENAIRRQQELLDLGQPGVDERKRQAAIEAAGKGAPAAAPPVPVEIKPFVRKNALNEVLRESLVERGEERSLQEELERQSDAAFETLIKDSESFTSRFKSTINSMSVFAEEGARNLQTAFADFLFDPFSKGLDGMLKGFVDVIRRMVAEAAAAQILQAIGGAFAPGSFFGTLFGGVKSSALGGQATPGRIYQVNEQGTEYFRPNVSGEIIPLSRAPSRGGGPASVTVAPVYNIDNRGATVDAIRALPAILEENNRRLMAGWRDQLRRGAFANG